MGARWVRGWREAALAWVVWLAASGLGAEELSNQSLSHGPLLLAGGVGLIVAAGLAVPLSASELGVAKTATIRRVTNIVFTIAAVAVLSGMLGLVDLTLTSIILASAATWLIVAVATSLRPVPRPAPDETAATMSWLPVRTTSSAALCGKRVFDITGALVLLALSSPVLLVVAVAVKAHDGGPVFFRQTRLGLLGQQFEMVKFRSMVTDAESRRGELDGQSERSGPLFKMTNDPRITPIGRLIRELSIDELPQLVNIVRGDMSLVGPRPALPDEFEEFDLALRRRVLVTPGLTGLWQAEARTDASFARFRELDLRYVSTASPALDLWILMATAIEVVASVVRLTLRLLGAATGQTDGIDLRDSLGFPDIIDLREAVGEFETDGAGGNDDRGMRRSTDPSSAIL